MSADTIALVTGKTDAERAAELLAEATPLLNSLCEILQSARVNGFDIQFQFVQNNFGRYQARIAIVKPLIST